MRHRNLKKHPLEVRMDFITDTYSLLWYFTEDPRLTKKAGIAMLMGALALHPSLQLNH